METLHTRAPRPRILNLSVQIHLAASFVEGGRPLRSADRQNTDIIALPPPSTRQLVKFLQRFR
jgi:hypothetical protein